MMDALIGLIFVIVALIMEAVFRVISTLFAFAIAALSATGRCVRWIGPIRAFMAIIVLAIAWVVASAVLA
jgi:hypothetical protein